MNTHSLFATLSEAAQSLGFRPTHLYALHDTLLRNGFPIASFRPLEIVAAQGESDQRLTYYVEVSFLGDGRIPADEYSLLEESLMESARRFVEVVGKAPGVVEVELKELHPAGRLLTPAGDCAVELKMNVVVMMCNA
jgi:hypothetical protein